MEEIEVYTPPEGERRGILQPALIYRFRVIFGSYTTYHIFQILTQQVMNCEIDMKDQILSIALRQTITLGMFNVLQHIFRNPISICVNMLDGSNEGGSSVLFHNCKCIDHSIKFDYSGGSEVAVHEIKFSYSDLTETQIVDWNKESEKYEEELKAAAEE